MPITAKKMETPPVVPPPEKEEEQIPQLDDIITDRKTRLELARYLAEERQFADAESQAKKGRKPLTNKIKNILGKFQVSKAMWGDWRINYYGVPTEKVSLKDLRSALLVAGLPDHQRNSILNACVKVGMSYTLRISKPNEAEEEE